MEVYKIDKQIFGERLKQMLLKYNETTYSLAKVVHLSPATISRYANGNMAPKFTTVEALANYFNVNPCWLMGNALAEENSDTKLDIYETDIAKLILSTIDLLECSQENLMFDGKPIDGVTKERIIESLKIGIEFGKVKDI